MSKPWRPCPAARRCSNTPIPRIPIMWDLMYQLATANRIAGQNKAAEKLLGEIVDRFNTYLPAHEQLAELYLEANNLEAARREVDEISRQKPGSADVIRFRIVLATHAGQPDEAAKFYLQLPETAFSDKLSKAQVAANLGNYPEAIRLLTAMQNEKPNDSAVTIALIQAFNRDKKREQGLKILADALKLNPKDERLLMYKQELDGATPGESDTVVDQLAGLDPFYREIQVGRMALSNANYSDCASTPPPPSGFVTTIRPPGICTSKPTSASRIGNWPTGPLDALTRLNADHANGLMYRWSLAMARGQWSDAIGIARQLTVKSRESFGQSWILKGQAYQANAQFSEALRNIRPRWKPDHQHRCL